MDNGTWTDNYGLNGSLVLSWTLSNGGNVRRAIRNAKINEEIGQIETEKLKRTMYNQIFKTFEEYNLKRQLRDVSRLATESAKLSFQIATEKFKSGAINSFDFRDIQVSYLNAANQMLQANYNLIDAYTELIRLTGGIVDEYTEEN
jgi:outer membrane protein TolC